MLTAPIRELLARRLNASHHELEVRDIVGLVVGDHRELALARGAILAWMARIVTTGEPVARADRESPPSAPALAPWYSATWTGPWAS